MLLPPDGKATRTQIGSPDNEPKRECYACSEAQHVAEILPFLLARTEMSQGIYDAVGGTHLAYTFPLRRTRSRS